MAPHGFNLFEPSSQQIQAGTVDCPLVSLNSVGRTTKLVAHQYSLCLWRCYMCVSDGIYQVKVSTLSCSRNITGVVAFWHCLIAGWRLKKIFIVAESCMTSFRRTDSGMFKTSRWRTALTSDSKAVTATVTVASLQCQNVKIRSPDLSINFPKSWNLGSVVVFSL